MKDFIREIQDFRYLNWSDTKLSPGTPGCFLKAYEEQGEQRFYYKLSNYDSYRGVFGHECINELIVSRLLEILQIEHLHYQLLYARICIDGKEIELRFIPKGICWFSGNLQECDRNKLLRGMDGVLHAEHLDKIWNMIWERWKKYVQICGKK